MRSLVNNFPTFRQNSHLGLSIKSAVRLFLPLIQHVYYIILYIMWTQNIVVYTARSFFDTHAMTVDLKSFFLYFLILFSLFLLALAAKRTYRSAVIIQFAIVFRPNNSSSFPAITLPPQEQVPNGIFSLDG